MPILSRFRQKRHHVPPQTQPRFAAQPVGTNTFTAEDWIDIQLLAHKTITLQSLINENRLASGLWHWRFFIDTDTDRHIMVRLQQRQLIEATNASRTCARLTPHGFTQIFHLCRHVRLAQANVMESNNARLNATL